MTIAKTPAVISRETVWSGYITIVRTRLKLADGSVAVREVESHGDAVAILPYHAERRVALLVRLFRLPAFSRFGRPTMVEACAGMIDPADVSAEAAARREAFEELGVRLDVLQPVVLAWPSPGVSDERTTLYLAPYTDADRLAQGGGAEGEHEGIEVLEAPLAHLAEQCECGQIEDLKLFALILALRLRRPELFLPDARG
jgi:nudix-type nucleoside diphosphatase (YffH/AdpP family)